MSEINPIPRTDGDGDDMYHVVLANMTPQQFSEDCKFAEIVKNTKCHCGGESIARLRLIPKYSKGEPIDYSRMTVVGLCEKHLPKTTVIQNEKPQQPTNKNKKTIKRKRPISAPLRHEVFKRDMFRCVECGAKNTETRLHVDHIISISQGGSDELSNLQTLCDQCNWAKHNRCWVGGQ